MDSSSKGCGPQESAVIFLVRPRHRCRIRQSSPGFRHEIAGLGPTGNGPWVQRWTLGSALVAYHGPRVCWTLGPALNAFSFYHAFDITLSPALVAYLEDPASALCIAFFSRRRLTGEREREKNGGKGEDGDETALANSLHVARVLSNLKRFHGD